MDTPVKILRASLASLADGVSLVELEHGFRKRVGPIVVLVASPERSTGLGFGLGGSTGTREHLHVIAESGETVRARCGTLFFG